MATYLNRSNFSGYNGSHFFLDLYYDKTNSGARFYAYIGSVDGYSAGGSSASVYINGTNVGSVTSIPARSNVQVGYIDVSGTGTLTATASCSTTWNGVGSASVSGSITVGPYITKFVVNNRDETSVTYDWSVSSSADYAWYSTDKVNWYDLPNSNIISGLTPGQPYNFYIRLRQASTKQTYDAGPISKTVYDYPKPTELTSGVINGSFAVRVENPLGRTYTLDLISNNNGAVIGNYTGNQIGWVEGFNDSPSINARYQSIPNSQSGTYYARVTYGSSVKTYGNGTYAITFSETPIVTTTAVDTGKTLTNSIDPTATTIDLTGSNKKIIKFISDVKVDVSATGQYYATISSLSTKYNNNTQPGASYTYSNVENTTFTGIAIDSRGLTGTSNASDLTLINYIKLTLDNLELYRQSETSSDLYCQGSGNYYSGSLGATNNALQFQIRWYDTDTQDWTAWQTKQVTIGSQNNYTFDFQLGNNFDYTKKYTIQVQVKDKCMATDIIEQVAKPGVPIMGLFENSVEVFGEKTFEKDNNGDVSLNVDGDLKINSNSIFDLIYPIGSIYMSVNSTSPSLLFGGTWERIGVGRTLISAGGGSNPSGDSNSSTVWGNYSGSDKTTWFPSGETGGELKHTLTEAELPNISGNWTQHGQAYGSVFQEAYGYATGTQQTGYYRTASQNSGSVSLQSPGFNFGQNQEHNNMQPYMACYMWKRTA